MAKVSEKSKVIADSQVLTLEEAACYLKIPEVLLKKQALLGQVPGRSIGGHWRFFKPALNQWLSLQMIDHSNKSSKEIFLAQAGIFANDPTLSPMVEEIYTTRRKQNTTK
jgi:hypothetical protein